MILKGHKNSVICIAADPTGRTFATASGDMTMRLWRYEEINAVAQIRAK
jgi:WD40 repeat protein